MNRADELRLRREALCARSRHLRVGLTDEGRALQARLAGWDRGLGLASTVLRGALRRPWWLAAGAVALVALKPVRALRWISRGAMVFSAAKGALRLLDAAAPPRDTARHD